MRRKLIIHTYLILIYCLISRIVEKFLGTANAAKEETKGKEREKTVRTPENIQRVEEFFQQHPSCSTRRASQELDIPKSSLHVMLHKDIKMKAYKIQIQQPLKEFDISRRLEFANRILTLVDESKIDLNKVWYTDEAHFYLSGYVNKQVSNRQTHTAMNFFIFFNEFRFFSHIIFKLFENC